MRASPLRTPASRRLYHEYAEAEPILDYHTHLPPQDVAANRQFCNLFEIWLEGDHYKWRAMRANGIAASPGPSDSGELRSPASGTAQQLWRRVEARV